MGEGDRVAILALNSDRYLEYFYAVLWAGGVIVPLNTRLAVPELIYMLNDVETAVLVVDEAMEPLLPQLMAGANKLKQIITLRDAAILADTIGQEEIITAAPIADAGRGGDDLAGIFYTGGTTGIPKGVMLTHDNIVSNAMCILAELYAGENWVYLHAAPMFHIADCQWNSGVTMLAGTHVFIPKFDAEQTLQTIESQRITHCVLVPTMVNMLCQLPASTQYDMSSLRRIHYGGSPMPPAVIHQAKKRFPHCKFTQGYGQTEASPNISLLSDLYHETEGPLAGKLESAGQPVINMEVKIVNENEAEVPLGTVGEIVTRGPHVMAGYWRKPEETASALHGGWLHTGDAGYMDEAGFIFIVDRLKDMVVSGGENVYSTEVENVLYQHPAVAMCAVFGIPDEKWGETVHAEVVLKDGRTASNTELINFCRQQIAGYKCPRSINIRQEPMPMSGAGKILKSVLRAPYWTGQTRQVN